MDAGQRAEDAGVVPPEVPDADDGAREEDASAFMRSLRATTVIPARSAASTTAGRSKTSVLPASTDSAEAPAARIASIVGDADDRDVEAHVLLRLGHLHDARAGPGEAPGARDHLVGALHRLDGHDGARPSPTIVCPMSSAGDRVRHAVAELEVLLLRPRPARAPREDARRRDSGVRKAVESSSSMPWSRMTSATAEIERVGVLRPQPRQHREQRQVGHDPREDLDVLHLAGHDGLRSTPACFNRLMHFPSCPSDTQ